MPGKKPDFGAALTNDNTRPPAPNFETAYGGLKLPASALSSLEWIRKSPNALTIDVELTQEEWFALIASIETIKKRYQWYLGDAMVYGIRREYGATDDQIQRVVELTGKAAGTLNEYYKTALLFEFHERSENLDFEQHRVLAVEFSQDTPEHRAERLRWLHIAETEKLSGRKLKTAIATAQLPASADGNTTIAPAGDHPALSDEMVEEEAYDLPDESIDLTAPLYQKRTAHFTKLARENRYAEIDMVEINEHQRWLDLLRKKVAVAKVEADRQTRMKVKP